MKVAFVIPEIHKRGGTERCVAGLAAALAARGHKITLFSATRDESLPPDVIWHHVPMIPRPHIARFFSFLIMNSIVRVATRLVDGGRFDIVHSTGPDVLRPTITTFHCCAMSFARVLSRKKSDWTWRSRLSRFRRWLNALSYLAIAGPERYVARAGARRVLAVSNVLASEVSAHYRPLPERLGVLQNGVDLREFHPWGREDIAGARRALAIPNGREVVLFVGYNWERKGLDVLVDALGRLAEQHRKPWTYLIVAGGTGRRAYMEDVRIRLNGNVRFLGTRADMPRIYNAADLLVLPSEQEPFGLPVLEAMACSVPTIVSRCSGVAEVITDGFDGVLLDDPTNPEELAGKIEGLMCDPEFRRDMGVRARKTAEKFSWDEIARQVEGIYKELLMGIV